MNRPIRLLCVTLALVPSLARAQARQGLGSGDSGLVLTLDAGGGTALGAGSHYTPSGRGEFELTGGFELPYEIRPEVALVIGVAPNGHVGVRPGVHVGLPETPLYVRAALDWSDLSGSGRWNWLLGGLGGELRLTGALGAFAEADLGIPIRSDVGLGVLVRAGISVRL